MQVGLVGDQILQFLCVQYVKVGKQLDLDYLSFVCIGDCVKDWCYDCDDEVGDG